MGEGGGGGGNPTSEELSIDLHIWLSTQGPSSRPSNPGTPHLELSLICQTGLGEVREHHLLEMNDIQSGDFITFIQGPQLNRYPKTLRFSNY